MELTKENYEELLPSLQMASSKLKGSERRQFLGQLALDIGYGGRSLVHKTFNISRDTLRKGIREIESGESIADKFHERGRHKIEEDFPELEESVKRIVDGASQIDPKFTSTRLYTRLSPSTVLKELEKQGYAPSKLPCKSTIGNLMKRMGYKRKKVAKTKPKKN